MSSRQQFDSGDGSEVSSRLSDVLRLALRAQVHAVHADQQLRAAMRVLSADARRRGLRAEQLIVVLREQWNSLPEAHLVIPAARREEVTARLISLCIEEFYAGMREDRAPG